MSPTPNTVEQADAERGPGSPIPSNGKLHNRSRASLPNLGANLTTFNVGGCWIYPAAAPVCGVDERKWRAQAATTRQTAVVARKRARHGLRVFRVFVRTTLSKVPVHPDHSDIETKQNMHEGFETVPIDQIRLHRGTVPLPLSLTVYVHILRQSSVTLISSLSQPRRRKQAINFSQ